MASTVKGMPDLLSVAWVDYGVHPASDSSTAARISSSSASRPTPASSSDDAIRPSAGPTKRWPQLFKISTLRTVGGLLHISGFIAGAQRTLFAPARIVAETRSSPRPIAARATTSAVAGATRRRSAERARKTCSTRPERSHQVTSVWIGSPAAMESVSSGTKRKAASVAMTLTSFPASLRRRITPGALYAAMPPVVPTSTLATQIVYRAGGRVHFFAVPGEGRELTRSTSTRTFSGKMRAIYYGVRQH